MFKITQCTKIKEGGAREIGYEITNSDGKVINDFAPKYLKDYYEDLNRQEGENKTNNTNAVTKLNEASMTNTADDIIDIFEELLYKLDITLPDKWRSGEEDEARIFGDTYFELENKIVERLRKGAK